GGCSQRRRQGPRRWRAGPAAWRRWPGRSAPSSWRSGRRIQENPAPWRRRVRAWPGRMSSGPDETCGGLTQPCCCEFLAPMLSEAQENAMTDTVTIYHTPACSTSRQVVDMVRETGATPEVVEYLKTGWTEPLLRQLMAESGLTARELMRTRGD